LLKPSEVLSVIVLGSDETTATVKTEHKPFPLSLKDEIRFVQAKKTVNISYSQSLALLCLPHVMSMLLSSLSSVDLLMTG